MHKKTVHTYRNFGMINIMDMNIVDKVKTLFWITTTIKRCGPISLNELSDKWKYHQLSGGRGFDRNTFRNHLENIYDIFGISIEYTRNGYCIADPELINSHSLQDLLINHVQVIDFYTRFNKLGDKLQTDDIPGGTVYLDTIGQALSENKRLLVEYEKFIDDKSRKLTVEPYCVKLKERRWYLLARNIETDEMRTYALDRIQFVEMTNDSFTPDTRIDLAGYYSNCIGVYADDSKIANIILKVNDFQAKYLRTLPFHPSQIEISHNVFKYHIDITPDLVNEILRMGANVTIMEPEVLRNAVRDEIAKMLNNY